MTQRLLQASKYLLLFFVMIMAIYFIAVDKDFVVSLLFVLGPLGFIGLPILFLVGSLYTLQIESVASLLKAIGVWILIGGVLESMRNGIGILPIAMAFVGLLTIIFAKKVTSNISITEPSAIIQAPNANSGTQILTGLLVELGIWLFVGPVLAQTLLITTGVLKANLTMASTILVITTTTVSILLTTGFVMILKKKNKVSAMKTAIHSGWIIGIIYTLLLAVSQ